MWTSGIGPLIGGIVFVHFGWRANFWLLAAFAAVVAALVYRQVPETLARPVPLQFGRVVRNYLTVISRRAVLSHLLPVATVFGALFAFVTSGPFETQTGKLVEAKMRTKRSSD